MTFAVGTVQGGSHAGWRIVKAAPRKWFCNCEGADGMELRPAYLTRCTDCGSRRPNA